jgi:hypothetical protein
MNWSNMIVAGGIVLSSLLPNCIIPLSHKEKKEENKNKNTGEAPKSDLVDDKKHEVKYVSGANGFHTTDIDLFIIGLTPSQATKKMKEIIDVIKTNVRKQSHHNASISTSTHVTTTTAESKSKLDNEGINVNVDDDDVDLLVSPYSITILGHYPNRHVQVSIAVAAVVSLSLDHVFDGTYLYIKVILRCYRSISEVLLGFDIDCCAVCYNGTHVFGIPRSIRSLQYRTNIG